MQAGVVGWVAFALRVACFVFGKVDLKGYIVELKGYRVDDCCQNKKASCAEDKAKKAVKEAKATR
eukprot:8385656-Pyramimonas_sp.AAC.1